LDTRITTQSCGKTWGRARCSTLRKKNAKAKFKNAGRMPALRKRTAWREARARLMGHFVHVARSGTACRAPTEEMANEKRTRARGNRALAIVLWRYVGTGPSFLRVNRIACATERQRREARARLMGRFVHAARGGRACRAPSEENTKRTSKAPAGGQRYVRKKANSREPAGCPSFLRTSRRCKRRKASGHPDRKSVGRDLSYVSGEANRATRA
jgi:hypothetical protein